MEQLIYGFLIALCALLGTGFVVSDMRRKKAERSARDAQVEKQISEVRRHNETTPLDQVVDEFDRLLDDE